LELINQHKKIIIVCRYNNEIKEISKQIKDKKVLIINGQTKDRHQTVIDAEDSNNVVVLINAACSEGYELPSFNIMVFYSYDFSLKNYIQIKGRVLRANKLKSNVYLSLVVSDTIDEDVYNVIQTKKDFDIKIYDKEREKLS
jgi:superfamily II DNA or RNA helicase